MKRTLRLLLAIWVPILLIGHGGGLPCCDNGCDQSNCVVVCGEAESASFHVVGECGPSGQVTVQKARGSCDVTLSGDAVGVATTGSVGGSVTSSWTTSAGLQTCSATRGPGERPWLIVRCRQAGTTCTSFFLPTDASCDAGTCAAEVCPSGQVQTLGAHACCPVCASADAGTPERDSGGDEATACDDGRALYSDYFAQTAVLWSGCEIDDDCTVVDIENECAVHCDVALNEQRYEGDSCDAGPCVDLEAAVDDYAHDRCSTCTEPTTACDGSLEARCIGGTCMAVDPP